MAKVAHVDLLHPPTLIEPPQMMQFNNAGVTTVTIPNTVATCIDINYAGITNRIDAALVLLVAILLCAMMLLIRSK